MQKMDYLKIAREVINIEKQGLDKLLINLSDSFTNVIDAILKSKGKLIVTGMGKSGLIGKKIAATLSSTGTPSMFLHPGEAYHGDLGMISREDMVLLISYSGETDEVLKLISFLQDNGNTIICMTGKPKSSLARNSHFLLDVSVEKEACPLELAPTASTTATLALGDAIAVCLMKARNFQPDDFARFHPGGLLGKRLLTIAESIMRTQNIPIAGPETKAGELVPLISKGRLGLIVVVATGKVAGIITDGDLRRSIEQNEAGFFKLTAADMMTRDPILIDKSARLFDIEALMNHHKITSVLVTGDDKLLGVVQIYDI
jgi:arabinose-5-phosphate isomerase